MCGGGGNYGQVAEGIGGMFAGGQQAGVGSVPAPTQSADTTSGIGQYMPMQDYNPMQQATNLYAPTQGMQPGQQFTAEQLYDPMAAVQARMASIPQTQALSVADLTPQATAAATETQNTDGLSDAQIREMYDVLGYQAVPHYQMPGLSLQPQNYRQYTNEQGMQTYLVGPTEYRSALRSSRGR